MSDKYNELMASLTGTEYPQWRNLFSSVLLLVLSTAVVGAWWYVYFTVPEIGCYKGFFFLSILWLAVQWVVIGYLYWCPEMPAYARNAIKLLILLANAWFILFLFSLKPCVA